MLAWNFLTVVTFFVSATQLYKLWIVLYNEVSPSKSVLPNFAAIVTLLLVVVVAGPLFGWLADAKCGNYRIFKVGSVTLFVAAVLGSLESILSLNLPSNGARFILALLLFIVLYLIVILTSCSFVACSSVSLQLGLDQLPDASSENITSFIFWHFGSLFAGIWIGNSVRLLLSSCISQMNLAYIMILSLFPVLFSGCILCLDFLLAEKWLIVESATPQSLKNIFRVLKFAAKHKAPISRSALTYWEEDIPSGMDLAKSRYGGPFTTEQVEDVKTFLKLLVVFLPLWLIVPALVEYDISLDPEHLIHIPQQSICGMISVYTFVYNPSCYTVLSMFLHEICIWPLLKVRYPSALKRVGITSMFTVVLNVIYLCWTIAASHVSIPHSNWFYTVFLALTYLTLYHLFTSVFEFICAQSPYSTRALMIGYTIVIVVFSIVIASALDSGFTAFCYDNCSVIHSSITLVTAIVGFILHCILAHWYKRRVRDDIDAPHRWVEEVYDRYLSHNAYH